MTPPRLCPLRYEPVPGSRAVVVRRIVGGSGVHAFKILPGAKRPEKKPTRIAGLAAGGFN